MKRRGKQWVNMWPKGSKNVVEPDLESSSSSEKKNNEISRVPSMGELSSISYSNGVLPPLGAQTNRKVKLRRFIISPFDRRYRAWEIFLVVLVFYTAWVSPFEFGFLRGPKGPLAITDNIVNGCFAVDIVLTFFVAYLEKSMYVLVDSPKKIAWRYAKGGLIFDVVSITPSELVKRVFPTCGESYGFFSMLRLWRLRRVSKMFESLEKDRNYSYTLVRFCKLTCVTLFSIHCSACLFYLIADRYKDPKKTWVALMLDNFHEEPVWDKYVMSMYWSITTATSTGYGDLHPVNTQEMMFDLAYILFLLGFSSYIIGNMTNLIVQSTSRTMKFRDTVNAATSFSKRNRLPNYLKDQMIAHLTLKYRTDSEGLQQQETLDALPKAIRSSISHYLFSSLVDKVYLFKGVSNDLLFQLVTEMKPEYFPHGEDIIIENEAPTDMYILVNGAVDLISKRDRMERVIGELKTGDVCGEIGVLCYRPRLFTVRTKRLSQLLRLNRTALFNILRANVADASMIMNNLIEHLKEYEDPALQEILSYTEHMLVHGKTDMPLSLCFAAARGYDILLNHMLGKGLDPNELDSNERAALHLASSVGSLECVLLLLDYGANPNIRDSEGNVPLWEAILGKHEAVAKALVENGATLSSGDVGQFACFAAEENNVGLLDEIVRFGGDVTMSSFAGTTALHTAISEENAEIVRFLVERGADVDKPDVYGCTPRALANNHCGSEEIRDFIREKPEVLIEKKAREREIDRKHEKNEAPYLRRYSTNRASSVIGSRKRSLSKERSRGRPSNFQNSLVGIITTGQKQNEGERNHNIDHLLIYAMLVHGKTDMPLSLCFAAARGYDILLNHMLGKGLDPNELDSNERAALHLASSVGSLECVLLLLDYGANPNIRDSEGNVPLWEAILGKHEAIAKALVENGATLSSGDVGQFACFAAEENNVGLLDEIVRFGGDVTMSSFAGTTALHTAISEENAEIVRFLIERGADVDKPDVYGCTPRALANNHCGSEEIRDFIREKPEVLIEKKAREREIDRKHEKNEAPYLRRYSTNRASSVIGSRKRSLSKERSRGRPSNFQNSLVGIITTGQKQNEGRRSSVQRSSSVGVSCDRARVTVSCPEKGDVAGKLVLLPGSLGELLELGLQKFDFRPTRVLTKSGNLVEDFGVIKDGDHLILATDQT